MGFLGKKPQTFMIPIYSTTVPYDKSCSSLEGASRNLAVRGFLKGAINATYLLENTDDIPTNTEHLPL